MNGEGDKSDKGQTEEAKHEGKATDENAAVCE